MRRLSAHSFLHMIIILFVISCNTGLKYSSDDILDLVNKSLMFTKSEILISKCPPPVSNEFEQYCPESYVRFCDSILISSTLQPFRYAVGEILKDENVKQYYLSTVTSDFELKNNHIVSYDIPNIYNKDSSAKISNLTTCLIQLDYPLIINRKAWVGVHWIGLENYNEYLLEFEQTQSGAWRLIGSSIGGYS